MDPLPLLIVEDHPPLAEVLRSEVVSFGFTPFIAATTTEARALLVRINFTVGVLEAELPDGSGLDLLEEIRNQHGQLRALVLSGVVEPKVVNRAHLLQASCVFKPDVISNVRAFLQRASASTGQAAHRTMAAAREVSISFNLTEREHQILELAALGVPRERLATELGVSENTLKTLIRRLLAKCKEARMEGAARAVLDEALYLACTTEPI